MTEFELLDRAARGMSAQRTMLDVAARNVAAAQAAVPGQSYERLVATLLPAPDDDDPDPDAMPSDDDATPSAADVAIARQPGTGDALTEMIAVLDAQRAYEANASVLAPIG